MAAKKDRFSGYQPRHVGVIEEVFCGKGCLFVDEILVPFPDCRVHGSIFTAVKSVVQ